MPNMRMTKNPMPSQDEDVHWQKGFKEVMELYQKNGAEAQRCLECKKNRAFRLPINIHIPDSSKGRRGTTLRARIRLLRNPLPCRLSAAVSVRRRRSAKASACAALRVAGRHRPSGAFCCRLAQRTRYRCHHHRAEERPQGCHYRFRPCGSYLRGRPRKAGLRRDDLRSAAPCRRRARVRHPGVPSAEVHRAEGSR